MSIKPRSLLIGAATYVPALQHLTGRKTGGTVSARYCYSVWLRHLCMLHRHGLATTFGTVVELGPGDSLGVGLAALLTGAESYIALDAVPYADTATNRRVLDDLVVLFRERVPIPDQAEFPLLQPPLPSYAFPDEFLPPGRLEAALRPSRIDMIRAALADPQASWGGEGPIRYSAPWTMDMIAPASVDLVISQGVLQFVHDLPGAYRGMTRWLVPSGIMSHEIAFQSIGITNEWNGHWACSETLWRLAAGRRRHVTNREPHSTHVALLQECGCRVVTDERIERQSPIGREHLAPRFRHLSDQDLVTSSALLQAVKLPEGRQVDECRTR